MRCFYLMLVFISVNLLAQVPIDNQLPFQLNFDSEVSATERKVVFIDLQEYPNTEFCKIGQGVVELIYAALEAEKIPAYKMNYKNHTAQKLNKKEWYKTLVLPFYAYTFYKYKTPPSHPEKFVTIHYFRDGSSDDKNKAIVFGPDRKNWVKDDSVYIGDEPLYHRDVTRLSLDQTIYFMKKGTSTRGHFVNFYAYDDEGYPPSVEKPDYRFSVSWEDFLKVLDESNALYYTYSFSYWWRGNIFTSDEMPMANSPQDFLGLMRKRKDIVPYRFTTPQEPMNIMDYTTSSYWKGLFYKMFTIEKSLNDTSYFSQIGIEECNEDQELTGKRLLFNWSDFTKVSKDSAWQNQSELCTMADAFRTAKFTTDDALMFTVSRNSKFMDGTSDTIPKAAAQHHYLPSLSQKKIDQLSLSIKQDVYTEDALNKTLTGKTSIASLLLSYVKNDQITAFANDTLKEIISKEKVYTRTIRKKQVKPYYHEWDYRKGDLVRFRGGEISRVLKDLKANQHSKTAAPLFEEYVEKSTTPWQPDSLSILEVMEKVTFNDQGYNKKYTIEAVGLYIPATRSQNGFWQPVCFVKWEELKQLLKQDNQEALIQFIENRQYFSYVEKTGVIKLVTK